MIAKRLSSKWFGLLLITSAALWIAGCGPVKPPAVTDISVEPGTDILAGETASLTVQATGTNLQFNWMVLRGKLSPQTGPAVIYTAPDTPGPDTVSVEVKSDGASTVKTITFNILPAAVVVGPLTSTPTETLIPTPTAVTPTPLPMPPTDTSTPAPPTSTPTPTPTPAPPTSTPTPTPTPTPNPIIADFEVFEVGEASDWWTPYYWGTGATLLPSVAYMGANCTDQSLLLDFTIPNNAGAGTGKDVYADWTAYNGLRLWMKMQGSEAITVRVQLKDADDEMFSKEVLVNTTIFTLYSLEWDEFVLNPFAQQPPAGNDQLDLNQIQAFMLEFAGPQTGTIYVDEIELWPTPRPAPDFCTTTGPGGTETIRVEPQQTVREIRIDLIRRGLESEYAGFSLWEVEIYGPGASNLSIGATATASSYQNSPGCLSCTPDKAIDGDMETRWSTLLYESPQCFKITLPEPQEADQIVLKWEAAYAKEYCVTVIE